MPLMRLSKKGKAERGKDESLFSPLAFCLSPTVIALVQQNSTWDKADSLNTLPTQAR